jgi:ABC transporter substrate binding protein
MRRAPFSGGSDATARFHRGTWCRGYMATRGASAATGEDEADRFRFPFAQSPRNELERPTAIPRLFRGAKSPWLRRGPNLGVERYSGEGQPERYAELVRDVVNTHPDSILAVGARLSLDFKMATTTIPIVTIVIDPIARGLVASIARPGGNITGVTIAAGLEIIGKRMGLLVEAMQKLSTLGYLTSRRIWEIQEGRQRERRPNRRGSRCRLPC